MNIFFIPLKGEALDFRIWSKMAVSNFKTIGEVLKIFQVTYIEENFISEIAFTISDYFREDLEFIMGDAVVDNSEFAICENIIYPILK